MTWLYVVLAVLVAAFMVCRALFTVSMLTSAQAIAWRRWDRIIVNGEPMRVVRVLSRTQVRVLHRRRPRPTGGRSHEHVRSPADDR